MKKTLWMLAMVLVVGLARPQLSLALPSSGVGQCGFCGVACVRLNPAMACPAIATEGKQCVEVGGVCKIVTLPSSVTPTCIPRPACLDDVNAPCLVMPPENGYFCPQISQPIKKPTPTPRGCYLQPVQCIQAPCNPIWTCPSGTPTVRPTCIPKPPCVDGIVDANGNKVYCDPKPGTVFCPEVSPTPTCRPRLPCMDGEIGPNGTTVYCQVDDVRPGLPPYCPRVTPTGPVPICVKRPACLDAIPPCMIPVPEDGFCPKVTVTPVTGDANGNGAVGLGDYAIWMREYLGRAEGRQADFNKDGVTNLIDFAIWKKYYVITNLFK